MSLLVLEYVLLGTVRVGAHADHVARTACAEYLDPIDAAESRCDAQGFRDGSQCGRASEKGARTFEVAPLAPRQARKFAARTRTMY